MSIPGFDADAALGRPLSEYRGRTGGGPRTRAIDHGVLAAQVSDLDNDDSCEECLQTCRAYGGTETECAEECGDVCE
ncbi:MAG: hypothetical protein ACYSWU_02130 [Planctomycetota bacterium]|jgi:hypothetical protein